jgi:hypothetical protein
MTIGVVGGAVDGPVGFFVGGGQVVVVVVAMVWCRCGVWVGVWGAPTKKFGLLLKCRGTAVAAAAYRTTEVRRVRKA